VEIRRIAIASVRTSQACHGCVADLIQALSSPAVSFGTQPKAIERFPELHDFQIEKTG
jgi:hypothetical protein